MALAGVARSGNASRAPRWVEAADKVSQQTWRTGVSSVSPLVLGGA